MAGLGCPLRSTSSKSPSLLQTLANARAPYRSVSDRKAETERSLYAVGWVVSGWSAFIAKVSIVARRISGAGERLSNVRIWGGKRTLITCVVSNISQRDDLNDLVDLQLAWPQIEMLETDTNSILLANKFN